LHQRNTTCTCCESAALRLGELLVSHRTTSLPSICTTLLTTFKQSSTAELSNSVAPATRRNRVSKAFQVVASMTGGNAEITQLRTSEGQLCLAHFMCVCKQMVQVQIVRVRTLRGRAILSLFASHLCLTRLLGRPLNREPGSQTHMLGFGKLQRAGYAACVLPAAAGRHRQLSRVDENQMGLQCAIGGIRITEMPLIEARGVSYFVRETGPRQPGG